jgi:type II secretory pathway component PulJ
MRVPNNPKAGFSLAEVMVAMTISMFILATSYATILSLAKGSESMINFSEMNGQSRIALEQFGRDARMASDVISDKDHGFSSTEMWIQRRTSASDTTPILVGYIFDANSKTFRRLVQDQFGNSINDQILLYDVEALDLYYYRYKNDEDALNPLETKHVQLEATLQRNVLNLKNTNYILSARFVMRNKDVTQ